MLGGVVGWARAAAMKIIRALGLQGPSSAKRRES